MVHIITLNNIIHLKVIQCCLHFIILLKQKNFNFNRKFLIRTIIAPLNCIRANNITTIISKVIIIIIFNMIIFILGIKNKIMSYKDLGEL